MRAVHPIDYACRVNYLIISGHDFRSKRKASVHFIARELAKIGSTQFFSIGFSLLSRLKKDPRSSLWSRANRIERFEDVDCYLWKTLLHPVNLRSKFLRHAGNGWFQAYIDSCPSDLLNWIRSADTVLFESGMSPIFFDLVKAINPRAETIYLCADALHTIECDSFVVKKLEEASPRFSKIRIPSIFLTSEFRNRSNLFLIKHGMDPLRDASLECSPFGDGTAIVSVGEMLFDPSFFEVAAPAFPNHQFHVIGGGASADRLASIPNIKVHAEMRFHDTLRYLKHAAVGVAAYEGSKVEPYLADTSMKLKQFSALGLPAVCPFIAARGYPGRFGYRPGDAGSIVSALENALDAGPQPSRTELGWDQVVERLINPKRFPDTQVS